jgi:outer membrane protein TolC
MRIKEFPLFLLAGLVAAAPGYRIHAQDATPFTLRDAVALSLDKSPDRKMAAADIETARDGSRQARTALLPNLGFSEDVTRGNDPVYVFGSRLRQQQFQQSDFALYSLNRPTPLGDFTTRFSGNWTAFDSWRTQLAIRRADLLLKSSQASASRSDQEILHRVVAGYEGVLFAAKRVDVAQHQVETADALLESSKNRVEAGMAVDADQLSATANLAERQQELIAAQGDLAIAWAELERAVGISIPQEHRQLQSQDEKRFDVPPVEEAVATALHTRPDRESLRQQLLAQKADVQSAKSGFGPTIGAFGSWQTDRTTFAGTGGNNWVAGAELRVDILPVAKREQLAGARATLERTQAASDSADLEIRLEVTRAWYAHQTAAQMLDVARASRTQSDESLRILKDRYEAGLATITDLLRAEDAQRQSAMNYWQAVSRNTLTFAELEFAMGTLTTANIEGLE